MCIRDRISDFLVSQQLQMGNGKLHPLVVVHAHIGDVGIGADIVIIKNGGSAACMKILHPGIVQGKAQHKGDVYKRQAYLPSVFILNFDTRGVSFGPAFQGKKSGSVY